MKINNELFRLIRVSRRMTQRDFAKLIGYSHGLVSHIETDIKSVSDEVSDAVIRQCNLNNDDIRRYKEVLRL